MKTLKRISTFGDRLKEYRERNDLTLADVEKLTNIPSQTLNRYELKQRAPKIDVANDIADKLNINPVWLSGYDVPMFENKDNDLTVQLQGIDFAIHAEVKDLDDDIKADILDFIKFKKQQRK